MSLISVTKKHRDFVIAENVSQFKKVCHQKYIMTHIFINTGIHIHNVFHSLILKRH